MGCAVTRGHWAVGGPAGGPNGAVQVRGSRGSWRLRLESLHDPPRCACMLFSFLFLSCASTAGGGSCMYWWGKRLLLIDAQCFPGLWLPLCVAMLRARTLPPHPPPPTAHTCMFWTAIPALPLHVYASPCATCVRVWFGLASSSAVQCTGRGPGITVLCRRRPAVHRAGLPVPQPPVRPGSGAAPWLWQRIHAYVCLGGLGEWLVCWCAQAGPCARGWD
jgi:hypothetical protein